MYAYVALRSEADKSTRTLDRLGPIDSTVSPFGLLGVHEYAYVALRSEADESTALSTAWARSTAISTIYLANSD